MSEQAIELGKQYSSDDSFMAAARLHQSKYRADVLKIPCKKYGSKLLEKDAKELVAYYGELGVREVLRTRYPGFALKRDGDLLRSEHIPFNLFGPLVERPELATAVVRAGLVANCAQVEAIRIEWAPQPKRDYLDDATSFDTFIAYKDEEGRKCGLGIEVKYTEGAYDIGDREKERVDDPQSTYWMVSESCGAFRDPRSKTLTTDSLRQFWRNHLLGLCMEAKGETDVFTSIVLYPAGNPHCAHAVPAFQEQLTESARSQFRGMTFENFIGSIEGSEEVLRWRQYLDERYLF